MTAPMAVPALGVHLVDVLVRPVEQIPHRQGGQLVEQIRITPAGSAGGTAITLAKLGASVKGAGATGDDSPPTATDSKGPGVIFGFVGGDNARNYSAMSGRIHRAGTETSNCWNGYVDGAVRSGEGAADEVLGEL